MFMTVPTAHVFAVTWDVTADFSATNNPTGTWSYGWTPTVGELFILYDKHELEPALGGSPIWRILSGPTEPNLWKNTSANSHFGVAPGQVGVHPGPSFEPSIARWTSPIAGTVDINGFFGAGDSGELDYIILHNTAEIFHVRSGGTEAFSIPNRTVAIGDTLDFLVTGGYGAGNTPLDITITSQSSPSCSSTVLTLADLRAEVEALNTSPATINVLTSNLDNVQTALDNGNNKAARTRLSNFIDRLVNRSNFASTNPDRLLLAEANSLICGAANVLTSIPLE